MRRLERKGLPVRNKTTPEIKQVVAAAFASERNREASRRRSR